MRPATNILNLRRRRRALAGLFALVSLILLASLGQSADAQARGERIAQHPQSPSSNPPGVTFTVRLKDGKAQFHPGEIIRLELLFSSSRPNTYRLDGATYDRSGRLEEDTYHLEPKAGAADPLRGYYEAGLFGFMGGGLRSTPTLEEKPYVITQDLNEWFRFDRPGKYKLYVTTGRVGRIPTPEERATQAATREGLTTTSNTIEFEILPPDVAWSERKLQEALRTIDAPHETWNEPRDSCRVLRFLGTEAAAREMIRRYWGDDNGCASEYHFGLISSPHRAFVIREMESRLIAPDQPVTSSYINTLSTLVFSTRHPKPVPPYPTGDEEKMKLWQDEMQKRREDFQETVSLYMEQLTTAVSRKQKRAQAVSLSTILEHVINIPREKRSPATSAQVEQVAAALPTLFLNLPLQTQNTLLTYYWKRIASAAMLPVLRQIYERKPSEQTRDIRGLALQRIYELSPDEGRRLIIKAIQSPHPGISPRVLSLLPDDTIPELDEVLAERMEQTDSEGGYEDLSFYSALLDRYATGSVFPRVRAAYGEKIGRMACAIQTPLLAYFLRVDPEYGAEALERALSSRKETGCYQSELSGVAQLIMSREVERVAAAHLNDTDLHVAVQAAGVLGQYGSANAEQYLWRRLEEWHNEWQGREREIRPRIKGGVVAGEPAQFETELVRALARSPAWLLDAEKFKKLQQLSLTEPARREAAEALSESQSYAVSITFNSIDDSASYFSVGQYRLSSPAALKEKLAQYPRGTSFVWKPINGGGQAEEQLYASLKDYLRQRGTTLEK
ncbi:MAG TPA: hypothetical protein VF507_06270 [Pyrinomonadaceae bacterium]|jgi:hypothetical protein